MTEQFVCTTCETKFTPRPEWIGIWATFVLGFFTFLLLWIVTVYLYSRRNRCVECGSKATVPANTIAAKRVLASAKPLALLLFACLSWSADKADDDVAIDHRRAEIAAERAKLDPVKDEKKMAALKNESDRLLTKQRDRIAKINIDFVSGGDLTPVSKDAPDAAYINTRLAEFTKTRAEMKAKPGSERWFIDRLPEMPKFWEAYAKAKGVKPPYVDR